MAVQMMSPQVADADKTPLTGEELARLGDIGRSELVKGEIVSMSPTGYVHGGIEVEIAATLRVFVRQHQSGRVFSGEVGIYTGRDPDTVRAADVAFVSNERMSQVKSQSYLDVAPELVVEVLSPDDRWSDLTDKLDEYFAIGVKVIWVVDPRRKQVYVYRSVTDVQRLAVEETLTGGEALPGFSVPVAELFASE
jgi:Uma2 family endonuclease